MSKFVIKYTQISSKTVHMIHFEPYFGQKYKISILNFQAKLTNICLFSFGCHFMKQKVQFSTNKTFQTPKMGKTGKNFLGCLIQNFVGNILFEMIYGVISCPS